VNSPPVVMVDLHLHSGILMPYRNRATISLSASTAHAKIRLSPFRTSEKMTPWTCTISGSGWGGKGLPVRNRQNASKVECLGETQECRSENQRSLSGKEDVLEAHIPWNSSLGGWECRAVA